MSLSASFQKLSNEFKAFYQQTTKRLDGQVEIDYPEFLLKKETSGDVTVGLSRPFSFRNVSQKGTRRSKRICIYISGKFVITGRSQDGRLQISRYSTQLLYCSPKESYKYNELKVSSGLHFDFEHEVQPVHPIFHMQLDNSALADEIQYYHKYIETVEPMQGENRFFRVPTSQMDIFSTLVMILADHFIDKQDPNQCNDFLSFVGQIQKYSLDIDLQRCNRTFGGHLTTAANLNSSSWYCELARQ